MHEVRKLMDDVFEKLDREYTKYGEPGILSERIAPVLKAIGGRILRAEPRINYLDRGGQGLPRHANS